MRCYVGDGQGANDGLHRNIELRRTTQLRSRVMDAERRFWPHPAVRSTYQVAGPENMSGLGRWTFAASPAHCHMPRARHVL